ncbi:uncharacterized protein LOC135709948 [Ochlerotatus camptorhynchus]|uniref:uncharacterized protein LOC135709948 n=1 Tax=Ochlerotatus camptorhynchus TaxID=644619 RepID=UPI0031DCEF34
MSVKIISNWSLPDSAFFPYSLHSIGDNGKMVLIVPGEGQIFTLVIKNLQQNIQSGGSPHKISRIKLAESDSSLAETVVTSTNTVSCKDNGELVVFSSFRECTAVEGISGVKAISTMESGKKILLIRLIGGRTLQLEVFDDLSGCQIGDCLKSFDLSWEKNEFDTSRYSQVHKMKTIVIDRVNSKFFKRFLNFRDLLEGTEPILFTMDNGLYWLKTLDGSYEIVTVKLYPSLILDFNFASSTGCFSVLLANAVMHIYSISEDTESLLIQEDSRHLGPTIDSHIFITELSTLLYSSGSQITQMRYYYSEINKTIQHVAKDIPIIGVTGITYLQFAEMAICVTENRQFYSVPITQLTDFNGNQQNDYFEVTSEILSQANQMTCFLTNEVNVESRMAKAIEQERLKVDILTSAINQNVYTNFFAADLKYHKHLPHRCYSTLILGESNGSNIFVQIDVLFRNGIKEVMMHQKNWMLILSIDNVVTQIPLAKVNYLADNTVRLLVTIDEYRFQKLGFPRIETSMSVRITHCHDSIELDIPIKIQSLDDIAELFEASSYEPNTAAVQESHLSTVAGDLVRHCEYLPLIASHNIYFNLRGLKDVPHVGKLLSILEIAIIPNKNDETLEKAYIRLGNQICEVQRSDQDEFRFISNSPGMLFLLKVLCSRNCQKISVNADKLKAFRLKLAQCETEREHIVSYYRQIRTTFDTWR